MKIHISNFKAMLPKFSSLLLPDSHAQVASDCTLDSGDIVPLKENAASASVPITGNTAVSAYLWRVNDDAYWLRFQDHVDVIRSPIADDAYSRIYWSGDSRVNDEVLFSYTPAVYTGGTEYPINYYRLGMPAPLSAPAVAITGAAPENPNEEARFYVYTYVGKLGEEGPPSPASLLLSVAHDGATVTVSDLVVDAGLSTAREIVAIRVYRTVSGTSGAAFLFVAEIPVASSSYADSKAADELAGELVSTTWEPPRTGMQGLGLTAHGVAYGHLGKILCLSELFLPYAWPRGYELTTADDIVAVGHYDYHLIVATNGRPAMVTGQDPSSMSMQELPLVESCVSARSMVSMGFCAIYASPNGLIMATASGAQNITEHIFSREDWDALNPSSIHAHESRGKYVFFWKASEQEKGGYIFDPRNPTDGVRSTGDWFLSGHRDITEDVLYLMDEAEQMHAWEGGEEPRAAVWRSKRFRLPRPTGFSAVRVRADDYDSVTVRVYADGDLYHEQAVRADAAMRLPRAGRKQEWEIEVESTARVRSISIAESVSELQG